MAFVEEDRAMFSKLLQAIDMLFDRPIELIVKHFENRLLELAMATAFLAEAVFLPFSPASFSTGGALYLAQLITLPTAILMFLFIGLGRIVALALNGHWKPYGAYVRAGGAALGVVMWLQIVAAFIVFAKAGNPIPFSTPIYVVLAVFEGISMFRALAGAKRNGRENLGLGGTPHRGDALDLTSQLARVADRVRDHRPAA